MTNKKLGLALGGGGARGVAHIGVIKTLLQHNLKPDFISGSSMGALIGAFYALGINWSEIESLALNFDKASVAQTFLDLGKWGQTILKGDKVKRFLEGSFGDKKIEDTKIPLAIVVCDLVTGKEVILKEGLIRDAIYASISVPGIFPPLKIGKQIMIDGGVINPTPFYVVKKMGADVVIGVDLIGKNRKNIEEVPNLINTLLLTYEIIRTQAMEHKIKESDENTIIIRPEKRDLIDSFKFYDIKEFINAGEESMAEILPKIRELLESCQAEENGLL